MTGRFIKDALFPRPPRGSLPSILQDGDGPSGGREPSPRPGRGCRGKWASSLLLGKVGREAGVEEGRVERGSWEEDGEAGASQREEGGLEWGEVEGETGWVEAGRRDRKGSLRR